MLWCGYIPPQTRPVPPCGGTAVLSHPRRFILREHRYSVGQSVYFTSGPYGRATSAAKGAYKIVRLLPSEGDDREYRIKSPSEPHERVAKESQLDRDF